FQALAKPVNKAINWIVDKIVNLGKKLWAKLKGKFGKKDKPKTPQEDIQDRWNRGLKEIRGVANRSRQGGAETPQLHGSLLAIKEKYRFQEIYAHRKGSGWAVYAKLNPDNSGNLIPIEGKTLLVGEGNLTFTEANLILGRNVPGNITATVYEQKGDVKEQRTLERAERLQQQGVTVEFGVDATKLHEGAEDKPKFDNIIWMFPHPGGSRASAASRGAALLADFFASAAQRIRPGGKITVTLRVAKEPNYYVSRWRPVEAAAAAGLRLVSQNDFQQSDYPGYGHETTASGANPADVSRGFTFIFTRD
ncbi:class I SAM-dependent methyltransferase, partial [Micromonospora sp. NPDC049559]|uniref:class I SAM-dependent methyltransferase n=1 Tax=Micromonospora sp. NPDC049559 TaxID=3155923 RepID=UPI00342B6943